MRAAQATRLGRIEDRALGEALRELHAAMIAGADAIDLGGLTDGEIAALAAEVDAHRAGGGAEWSDELERFAQHGGSVGEATAAIVREFDHACFPGTPPLVIVRELAAIVRDGAGVA